MSFKETREGLWDEIIWDEIFLLSPIQSPIGSPMLLLYSC